jgi:undecaprenyl diphosphate synthase
MGIFTRKNKKDDDLLSKINMKKIPKHIAIIMDGNGRWAKKRNLPRTLGHAAGVEALRDIVKASSQIGVKVLTLYAFSTENWKRPKNEVNALMNLLVEYLKKEVDELHQENVKIITIGDITKLQLKCQNELNKACEKTKNNSGLILNLALNYGGRSEIVEMVKTISEGVKIGKIELDEIDENMVSNNLYTKGLPDPDLIIRPSGELRISNFLLWQCAYSEFWFSDIYWPDFKKNNLYKAIIDYQGRDRRFGGIRK